MVRTLKELDTIDITHLKELVTLSHMIKNQEAGIQMGTSQALSKPAKQPKKVKNTPEKRPKVEKSNPS